MGSLGHHSFAGKRVLVTGGGRGIGYDIVKRFYNDGATVFVVDKDQVLLEKAKIEMPNLITVTLDLTNWEETQAAVLGMAPLDHLVNNAGVLQAQRLIEVTPQNFDMTIGVNLRALLAVSQAFVRGNKETGHPGTIVNISSLADRLALYGGGIYATSKAAVTRLTMVMAHEFTEYNTRTNCVNPSFVATEMVKNIPMEFHILAAPTVERTPIKEPMEVTDIVEAVIFLSSPSSGKINGTSLVIDGGCRAAS